MNNGLAILLVEDNPSDEGLTIRALQKGNLHNDIVVVRDGQEALDYLYGEGPYAERDISVQPELILLDLKLPKVSGLEVLQRIREDARTEFIPVVVLTSSTEEIDVVESYRLGANSYVSKPVEFSEFSEAVRQLGCYWVILNRNAPHRKAVGSP